MDRLPIVALTCVELPVIIANVATNPPSLGVRIRRARERARLSQEELAALVGASKRAVGDWENDRRKPRNRLGALEDVLGVSLDDSEQNEPDLPSPEEMERLREHAREVLGDKAAAVVAAIDATYNGGSEGIPSGAAGAA